MSGDELIKISEYQRRRWGEHGTPLSAQAIRDQIKRGDLPGEQIGKMFFVNWTRLQMMTGNNLVDRVLRRVA